MNFANSLFKMFSRVLSCYLCKVSYETTERFPKTAKFSLQTCGWLRFDIHNDFTLLVEFFTMHHFSFRFQYFSLHCNFSRVFYAKGQQRGWWNSNNTLLLEAQIWKSFLKFVLCVFCHFRKNKQDFFFTYWISLCLLK